MDKETQDKIVTQSLKEISFARRYKQGKVTNWNKNEEMYYGRKRLSTESRANVDLGRMQEFVHTLLSKIDNPLIFKFVKRKEAQIKRVRRLNALRETDAKSDNWDIKDLVGKKQGIIYGRAIYSYYADSIDKMYKPHLGNVDVYDFLVDPSAGGIDLENGSYCGDYGVVIPRAELEKDSKAGKESYYIIEAVKELLAGVANATDQPQEETNKRVRQYGQGTWGQKQIQDPDKFKFWRWFTTFEGKRYYLLLQERAGRAILVKPLTEVFTATRKFPKGPFPYWTWAAFPDLTEFWTPSYCDYVREIFMAQNVNINQMLDNAEAINKPQKVVNVNAIENLAELKYRRDGTIKVKNDIDANKAVQFISPAPIQTPIMVFNTLEAIQEKASGVTSGAKGVSDEDGKVGIYEGNQEASADRFGLLNKSYAFGYGRFGELYELGVREHLNKKVAVDMIGPMGIETEMITKRDIFRKDDDFTVITESSNAESALSMQEQKNKLLFLQGQLANPTMSNLLNPKKIFEEEARIVGFDDDKIKELMDTSEFGNSALMSEADRDIESLLDGEDIEPNTNANNAYKQRMVTYVFDHLEDMTDKQSKMMVKYIESLASVIAYNEARALNAHEINQLNNVANGVVGGSPDMAVEPAGIPAEEPIPAEQGLV